MVPTGIQFGAISSGKINLIYYRNITAGIYTALKLRNNEQYVSIVFHALIIRLKPFEHKIRTKLYVAILQDELSKSHHAY